MLINDKEITKKNEDRLARDSFVENLASAIKNWKKNEKSLSIGLYGEWGSGKSSVLNLISQELKDKEDIIIFNFNPWIFSDTKDLIDIFFIELTKTISKNSKDKIGSGGFIGAILRLTKTISKNSKDKKLEKFYKNIRSYSKYLKPLSKLDPTGISEMSFDILAKEKSLEEIKEDIEEDLKSLGKKILIIIDDIDRLDKKEIKEIFKMVKVLGDFKSTIYLLSMDKEPVIKALEEVQNLDGAKYLEKIINAPLEMPNISKESLNQILKEELGKIPEDEEIQAMSIQCFKNIRDIKRYINILNFDYAVFKNKIDINDLANMTIIKVFEPEIFNYIKNNGFNELQEESYEVFIPTKIEVIKDKIKKLDEKILENILLNIFNNYNKETCISEYKYFNIYFNMKAKDIISYYELEKDILNTNDEKSLEELMNNFDFEEFEKILLNNLDKIKDKLQIIFNVLMNYKYREILDYKVTDLLIKIALKIEDEEKVFNLYQEAMKKTNNVDVLTNTLMITDEEIAKKYPNTHQKIFNANRIPILREIWKEKIKEYSEKNNILDEKIVFTILVLWKALDEAKYLSHIKEKIKEKANLIKFLKLFIRSEHDERVFNYEGLKTLIDPKEIFSRVKEIKENYQGEDQKLKLALEKFITNYEEENKDIK